MTVLEPQGSCHQPAWPWSCGCQFCPDPDPCGALLLPLRATGSFFQGLNRHPSPIPSLGPGARTSQEGDFQPRSTLPRGKGL